jgi:hypothetical protein
MITITCVALMNGLKRLLLLEVVLQLISLDQNKPCPRLLRGIMGEKRRWLVNRAEKQDFRHFLRGKL